MTPSRSSAPADGVVQQAPLPRQWKLILGFEEEAARVRHFTRMLSTLVARERPGRYQVVIDEDRPDVFIAETNCSWQWLQLAAWQSGTTGLKNLVVSESTVLHAWGLGDWNEYFEVLVRKHGR